VAIREVKTEISPSSMIALDEEWAIRRNYETRTGDPVRASSSDGRDSGGPDAAGNCSSQIPREEHRSEIEYHNSSLEPADADQTQWLRPTGNRDRQPDNLPRGQTPVDKDGNMVGTGDFRTQTKQAFENVKAALAAAGVGFDQVVRINYYVLDMGNAPVLREIRNTYLGSAIPASTLVEVKRLAREEYMIEIEATAVGAK
jgi:enamine deaminase RidA (YjgF/YER057c/UK114 family)